MILVVDGYNILKQFSRQVYIDEVDRIRFARQLAGYAKAKGHKVVLVFDGRSFERPDKERIGRVYVVYSGVDESADTYIKRYLTDHKANDLMLVSTDRAIGRHAWGLGIPSLDADDFYQLVCSFFEVKAGKEREQKGGVVKLSQDSLPEVDELMMELADVVPQKSEDYAHVKKERVGAKRTYSKKDKRLLKKVKKL